MMRPDPSSLPPTPPTPPSPPPGAKNVLYILVDDLRPDVAPYGASWMTTPNINALALAGTTFNRAYCNIAVCSPSRMSFLTGRYPHHTRAWNFLNHFRQANCEELPEVGIQDAPSLYRQVVLPNGGAGQCCSLCTEDKGVCQAWSLSNNICKLHNRTSNPVPVPGAVSGIAGTTTSRGWTPLPQHFREHGWLTLSTGKIFHTEEGGVGPAPWDGVNTGMPPLQDPPSWSTVDDFNTSMTNVNAVAPMRPCDPTEAVANSTSACSVNASLIGDVPMDVFRMEDRIISDDALLKMGLAVNNYKKTGQPFFLAVGFRKPHLPFRHPAPYDGLYPDPSVIPLAKYKTMDASVPPVAYHTTTPDGLAENPYIPLPDEKAGILRRDYYAAISWTDWNIGRVLAALEASGLANDTAIAFHGDHGWSLGEYGEWEKFTNWEFGARVPLVISAPWMPNSSGVRTDTIVELIDVYPTLADLAGIPVPQGYGLDGTSLVPVLEQAAGQSMIDTPTAATDSVQSNVTAVGQYALSVYPRCPNNMADPSSYWNNSDCVYTERATFPIMGVSIRTDVYRYTEWRHWNGTAQAPIFTGQAVGIELYDHTGDDGTSFDGPYEVFNVAGQAQYAQVQAQLAAQLRAVYPYHG